MGMIRKICAESKSDPGLQHLLDEVQECAEMYLFAQKTQGACDGTAEFTIMKEKFRDCIDKVIQYCKEKEYVPGDVSYDADTIADEIVKYRKSL